MRTIFRTALLLAIALLAIACGDNDPTRTKEPVAAVRLSTTQHGLIIGQTVQLSATALDRNGAELPGRMVSWRSENRAVASVSTAGLVTATGVGTTSLVASSEGREARATIAVAAPSNGEVASIEVTPSVLAMTVGQMRPIEVTPRDAHGTPLEGRTVEWSVANEAVVEVSSLGIVTAIGIGTTQIGVKVENKFAHVDVSVGPAPVGTVASITLDATTVALEEGATRQLVATPRDAQGQPIAGLAVVWTSSDENVARVGILGLVTGNSSGVATITARVHGKLAQATATVSSSVPYELVFGAYASGRGNAFRLDIGSPDATPVSIFPDGRTTWLVRPSPDGSKLAWAASVDGAWGLFVSQPDGSNPRRIVGWDAGTPGEPTWSPDGKQLAYTVTSNGGRGNDIWVVTIDYPASAVNITVDVPGVNQFMPAWSPVLPDGTSRIAFGQQVDGMTSVWTMLPDGTDKRRVSTGGADVQPAWSPDGRTIAFQRSNVAIFGDIWLVDANGGNERALMPFYALPGPQWAPAWSPDGRMIAFTSSHETYGSGEPVLQVYTVWADGSKLARRTGLDALDKYNPAWIRR